MPKRKRSYTPKPSAKRMRKFTRKFKKRSMARMGVAARVSRVESIIKKTLEKKYSDYRPTAVDGDPITNAASLDKAAFFRIADVGAGESKRVGNKVTLLSQRFMMNLVKGGPGDKIVRILVVNNPNYESSATITKDDVLQFGNWAADEFGVFTSPYQMNVDASKKYKVLYDKTFSLTDIRPYVKIDFMKKYGTKTSPGKVCDFEFDTSDFPTNHRVSVFAITDHTSGTNAPRVHILCRNKYIDA